MVKIVNGPFEQDNMHLTLHFCQDQARPTRKELNVQYLPAVTLPPIALFLQLHYFVFELRYFVSPQLLYFLLFPPSCTIFFFSYYDYSVTGGKIAKVAFFDSIAQDIYYIKQTPQLHYFYSYAILK